MARLKSNSANPSSQQVRERLLACPPTTVSARQGKILIGSVKLWKQLHERRLLWPTIPSRGEGISAIYSTDAVRAALAAFHAAAKPAAVEEREGAQHAN